MKPLYKSRHSVVGSGIMGGLGEWMEVHPGLLRFSYVVLILLTGILPGIALYGIMHFLIPEAPHHMPRSPRIPNSY